MTTASGRIARIAATVSRIRRNRRGACGNTSARPATASSESGTSDCDALLPHLLAADAGDAQPAAGALAHRPDQRGAERVARGLAGDDEDKRRGVAGGHAGTLAPAAATALKSRRSAPYRVAASGVAESRGCFFGRERRMRRSSCSTMSA